MSASAPTVPGSRRASILRGSIFAVAAAALVAGAVIYPGFKTTEVELNDGGVWVVSKSRNAVGRLNYPSRVLDGAVTPASAMRVVRLIMAPMQRER